MAVKSQFRVMMTSRWMRWAALRTLCRIAPTLGRRLSFPTRSIPAISIASEILEQSCERLTLNIPADRFDEAYRTILTPARGNDRGDCSTYALGYTTLETQACIVRNCVIAGNTLSVMRASDLALVQRDHSIPNHNQAKAFCANDRAADAGLHITLSCNGNYFHFFSNDILPILRLLRLYGDRLGNVWIVARESFPPFVFQTLDALRQCFPALGVVRLGPRERLVGVEALIQHRLGETGGIPATRDEADQLRGILLATAPSTPCARLSTHIFVSRGGARLRRLKNEADLASALSARGYATFTPDGSDQRAQIEAFHAAEVIVTVHGAALTNLLFCKPGTKIVELFPANRIKSAYFWLATQLGLEYHAVIGSPGDLWEGFTVDVAHVLALTGTVPG